MTHVPKPLNVDVTQFRPITQTPKRVDWGSEEVLNQPRMHVVTQVQKYFIILILDLNDEQTYQNYTIFPVLMQFERMSNDDFATGDSVQVSAFKRVIVNGKYKPILHLPNVDFPAETNHGWIKASTMATKFVQVHKQLRNEQLAFIQVASIYRRDVVYVNTRGLKGAQELENFDILFGSQIPADGELVRARVAELPGGGWEYDVYYNQKFYKHYLPTRYQEFAPPPPPA